MKPVRVLGVIALMTAALLALIGAGSASATVLCTNSSCTTTYASGTTIDYTLKSGTTSRLSDTSSNSLATCTGSTVRGKISSESGASISSNLESLTWSGCSQTTTTIKNGSLAITWTSGTSNGSVSSSSSEVTMVVVGVSCTYGTGAGTTLGTLKGGEEPVLSISAVVSKTAGSFICPSSGKWTAEYVVTEPHALYVGNTGGGGGGGEEGGGGATSTSLTTSLSGESKSGEEITVSEGSKVKDTATLSGTNASKATGTVKYKVYKDKECKELVTSAGEVTVSGGKVPASEEKELEAGRIYYWQAEYGGDTNNLKSTSTCGKEVLTVKASTSLSTSLSGEGKSGEEITVNEGSKVKDTATLSGTKSSTATGKVKFKVYKDKECKELATEAGEGSLSEGKASSEEKTLEAGRVYYWQAEYAGDSLHQASTGTCGKEVLTVKAAMTLETVLLAEAPAGEEFVGAEVVAPDTSVVGDAASLSGTAVGKAGGSVTYKVYSDSECKELVAETGEVEVKGGEVPASEAQSFPSGVYYWRAEYSGDSLHQGTSDPCGSEIATIKAATSLATSLSGEGEEGAEITVAQGSAVVDQAVLSGSAASEAGGSVTYKVYSDSECKELVAEAGEVEVKGGGVPSSEEEALPPGVYFWQADYSGDGTNQASQDKCPTEILLVTSTVTTELTGEGETAAQLEVLEGAAISDKATLGGPSAATATGTVTYKVYSDSECKELVAEAGEVEVKGGEVPSSEEETLPQGTYYWRASYSGDEGHPASSSECGSEIALVVTPTSLTTELSGGEESGEEIEVEEGTEVTDTATLSGANAASATGFVSYRIYADNKCEKQVATVDGVEVEGKEAPTSEGSALPPGTYYWQAEYSGDGVNQSAKSACGSEVEVVTAPLTLTLSGGSKSGTEIEVEEGAAVTGNASLHGEHAESASGTITYGVYADGGCEELIEEAGEFSFEAGEVPSSEEVTLPPGLYYWRADYSGDEANPASQSKCQDVDVIVLNADDKYAALGDSYSSGEGTNDYYAQTDQPAHIWGARNLCHRGKLAWPARVAEGLFGNEFIFDEHEVMKQQPPSFIFRACSGAVTENLWSNKPLGVADAMGQYDEWTLPAKKWLPTPAQSLWLERPGGTPTTIPSMPNLDIRLVTLTIGGNDAGFPVVAKNCIAGLGGYGQIKCMTIINEWMQGVRLAEKTFISPSLKEGIPSVAVKLPRVLDKIHSAAPHALIRVPLYPQPLRTVPRGDIPLTLGYRIENVGGITVATRIEDFLTRLNATIQQTVAAWAAANKWSARVIAGTENALLTHQLGDPEPWINGAQIWYQEGSFHPNCFGHIAIAETVLRSFSRAIPKGWKC